MDESKKRRGRKPKEVVADTQAVAAPKRCRKPKVVFAFDSSQQVQRDDDAENVILKLKVHSMDGIVTAEGYCKEIDNDASIVVGAYNESSMSDFSAFHVTPCVDACVTTHSHVNKIGTNKVVELLKDFDEKTKTGEWPLTTSLACYWCCHRFDTPPVGLPCKYRNGVFYVTGCFCSLECAAAYNVMQLRDGLMEERMNLLNFLARELGYKTIVKAASPRQSLQMFGGNLSIEDFRCHHLSKKYININFPPMVVLISQLEEVNDTDVSNKLKYVPLDTDRVDKYIERIKLKRSLPVNVNNNTLENVMQFSIKTVL